MNFSTFSGTTIILHNCCKIILPLKDPNIMVLLLQNYCLFEIILPHDENYLLVEHSQRKL